MDGGRCENRIWHLRSQGNDNRLLFPPTGAGMNIGEITGNLVCKIPKGVKGYE